MTVGNTYNKRGINSPIFYYEELMKSRDRTMRVYSSFNDNSKNSGVTPVSTIEKPDNETGTTTRYINDHSDSRSEIILISPLPDQGLTFSHAINWQQASQTVMGSLNSAFYNAALSVQGVKQFAAGLPGGDKIVGKLNEAKGGIYDHMGNSDIAQLLKGVGNAVSNFDAGDALFNPADSLMTFNGSQTTLAGLSVSCVALSGFNIPLFHSSEKEYQWNGTLPVKGWLQHAIVAKMMAQPRDNKTKVGGSSFSIGVEKAPNGYTYTNATKFDWQSLEKGTTVLGGTFTLGIGQNTYIRNLLCESINVSCSKHLTLGGDFYMARVDSAFRFATKITATSINKWIKGE